MTAPRIAMVLNSPGFGGVTEVVYQLLRRLPAERFAPHLFFLKCGRGSEAERTHQLDRFAALGIEIGMASGREGKIGAIGELASWLDAHCVDVVHTHSYRPNLYGRMAAALLRPRGLRVVAHYHNHYDDKWSADGAALALETALASSTDAMIAVSPEVRVHVAAKTGVKRDRIEVIRNGVDLERFKPGDRTAAREALGLEADAFFVGIIGRISEQKGHEDLVAAAIRLAPEMPRVCFIAFGEFEDRELCNRLQERTRAAGLAERFTFPGHLTDIPLAFAAVDIVAVPSRWEGYPLVVAEAMACGRPMVATSVSAIPDMTGQGEAALLVTPRQPGELAEALRLLVESPVLRATLAERGFARSSALSWANATEAVTAIYDRLLSPAERSRQCA